jgi:eukaryotic-like serine/threonine-protein kinase
MSQLGQLAPGSRVGRYEVVRLIGAGGMGEVYQATHEFTKKSFALKVLKIAHADRETLVEKMRAEAMLLCRIRHEHLVEVHDAGLDDNRIWMAMELLDGESLRERLEREGATRPDLALEWGAQIADGLDVVHRAGVIHRDLKPENVFITRGGSLKVLDFGTAKFEGFGHSQTKASDRMGTLPYMSPEHLAGDPLDGRSDVFAVGIILYEILAGRHPFADPDGSLPPLQELIGMMLAGTPESLAPFLGDEVWAIVARCLGPRGERFGTMGELSAAARQLRGKISGVTSGALRLGSSGQTQLGQSWGSELTPPPVGVAPRGVGGASLALMAALAATLGAAGVLFGLGEPSAAIEPPLIPTSEPIAAPPELEAPPEPPPEETAASAEPAEPAEVETAAPLVAPPVRPPGWHKPAPKKKNDEIFGNDDD